jgi:nitrite reductase (NADH) small subunit
MERFVRAARLDEIPEGRGLAVELEGRAIALFLVGEGVHAIEDRCPHQFAPLSDGTLCGRVVTCAYHAWRIDVTTGRPSVGAFPRVAAYPVKVEDGVVYVGVPAAPG